MITFKIGEYEYIHIQDFADITGRSKQAIRRLIEDGNSMRRMKSLRDKSRLLIPLLELAGFPFVKQGKQMSGRDIYHYFAHDVKTGEYIPILDAIARCDKIIKEGGEWESEITFVRELCVDCTFNNAQCLPRSLAEAMEVPQGDK